MKVRMYAVPVVLAVFVVASMLVGCPKAPEPLDDALVPDDIAGIDPTAEPTTLAEALAMVTAPNSMEIVLDIDGQKMTQRVLYENGQPAKMVMQSAELGDTLIYIDVAAKHMVIYDPSDNTAIESELDDESAGDFTEILVNADNLVKEVDILSVEDVNGVSCWVVETTMEGEEAKAKVWIDREFGLIRQIDDGETPITIEYSRLNEIPEAEFEVPQV